MHEVSDIIRLLARLNLHYPRSGSRGAAEIAVIAQDLADDLAPWSMEAVELAFRAARRECEFYPSTARLRELCARCAGELERQRQRELPGPDMCDAENIERGRRWCAIIVERLRRQGFEGRVRSTRPIGGGLDLRTGGACGRRSAEMSGASLSGESSGETPGAVPRAKGGAMPGATSGAVCGAKPGSMAGGRGGTVGTMPETMHGAVFGAAAETRSGASFGAESGERAGRAADSGRVTDPGRGLRQASLIAERGRS